MPRHCQIAFALILTFTWAFGTSGDIAAGAERLSVTSTIANIRSGPGGAYGIMWKVEKHHPLIVVEKSGSWLRIRDFEGDQGWVHKSLLGNVPAIITNQESCHVRSGPGTNNEILFTVGAGIPFRIVLKNGNWLQIEHADGDRGWIHQALTW
jgi:SH3-like domain-containing protein